MGRCQPERAADDHQLEATRDKQPDNAGTIGTERKSGSRSRGCPGNAVADRTVEADRGQCQQPER